MSRTPTARIHVLSTLDDRLAIGHVARASMKHDSPVRWLEKVINSDNAPQYLRYLATELKDGPR